MLTLTRTYRGADCTLGVLTIDGLTLSTIERPWVPSPTSVGGTKGVSCVPPGIYKLVTHDSEAHPLAFALVNPVLGVVHFQEDGAQTDRSVVLIHSANYASELRGCIAPGMSTGLNQERHVRMVQESRKAMKLLNDKLTWANGLYGISIT
jgi:hypothetical protein